MCLTTGREERRKGQRKGRMKGLLPGSSRSKTEAELLNHWEKEPKVPASRLLSPDPPTRTAPWGDHQSKVLKPLNRTTSQFSLRQFQKPRVQSHSQKSPAEKPSWPLKAESVHTHHHGPWDCPQCSPSVSVQAHRAPPWPPVLSYSSQRSLEPLCAAYFILVCGVRAVCSPAAPAQKAVSSPTLLMGEALYLCHCHLHKVPNSPTSSVLGA